jgi:hypothetical protein
MDTVRIHVAPLACSILRAVVAGTYVGCRQTGRAVYPGASGRAVSSLIDRGLVILGPDGVLSATSAGVQWAGSDYASRAGGAR